MIDAKVWGADTPSFMFGMFLGICVGIGVGSCIGLASVESDPDRKWSHKICAEITTCEHDLAECVEEVGR